MLACDATASLYQYHFLYGGYLQEEVNGQQNPKLTFSVFKTWFQYHLERKSFIWQVC